VFSEGRIDSGYKKITAGSEAEITKEIAKY